MTIPARAFKARLQKVLSELKRTSSVSALLLTSSPAVLKHDVEIWHRQDSDFYYLTGIRAQRVALLVRSDARRPLIMLRASDPHTVLWDGEPEGIEEQARAIGAEVLVVADVKKEIEARLKGAATLYFQNNCGMLSGEIAQELMQLPSYRRARFPERFANASALLQPLRLIKSADEIAAIRDACEITARSIFEALPLVQAGSTERQVAAAVEYWFRIQNAEVAFNTIAAAGPNAATLHHRAGPRVLRRGEPLLLDCGSEFDLYASDITRVLPVGRPFSDFHNELYSVVLEAQEAALKKVRHNVRIGVVYDAAARILTEGLVALGVLRGKARAHFEKKSYKAYFPHGIGHSIGLDVHDVGDLRGNNAAVLKKGMVFTVEPGLYFPRRVGAVPASGVRIEDTVAVTERGCTVLTGAFPKDIATVEALVTAAQN
jgi:Xaa-Pro aminopeptidase